MCDALGKGGLSYWLSRTSRVSGVPGASVMGYVSILASVPFAGERFTRNDSRGAACQSRPSRAPSVASNALRTCAFQQLARRNHAANAHGNAGDNGRGAKNDAPCSCAFHGSLLSDVHCCLLDWMYLPCALPVTLCFSLCSARCSGFLLFATSLHAVLTFCFALRLRFPFRPARAHSLFPAALAFAPPTPVRLRGGFGCSRRCLPCHRESRGSSRCPGEGTRPSPAYRSARTW